MTELIPDDIEARVAEALALEAQGRDFAFLADLPEPLCGTAVFPLDLRNLVLLTHAGNPFICGGAADLCDVRQLLWVQSPLYRAVATIEQRRPWWQFWRRRRIVNARQAFVDSLPTVDEAAAVADVRAWIDKTFADAPPGKGRADAEAEAGVVLDEPIASFVAGWVDLLGSEYGWTDDRTVGTATRRGVSLKKLFQYYRCCLRRRDPKHPFSSALVARIHGEWLRESIKPDDDDAAPAN